MSRRGRTFEEAKEWFEQLGEEDRKSLNEELEEVNLGAPPAPEGDLSEPSATPSFNTDINFVDNEAKEEIENVSMKEKI